MTATKLLASAILLALVAPAQAATTTLTFDSAGTMANLYVDNYMGIGDTYTQDGYTLTVGTGQHFDSMNSSGVYFHNGSANTNYDNWAYLTFQGGQFNLNSFVFNNGSGEIKTNLNGSPIAYGSGINSVNLTGVTWVAFSPLGNGSADGNALFLDNVNVAAVPEAQTYAMMLAGLGLVGFATRRRMRAAV